MNVKTTTSGQCKAIAGSPPDIALNEIQARPQQCRNDQGAGDRKNDGHQGASGKTAAIAVT
jgi:hypothetical protein